MKVANKLRFRAWDGCRKCWRSDDFYISTIGEIKHLESYELDNGSMTDSLSNIQINEKITICQSTGLLDKNCKEVFEGDVVYVGNDISPSLYEVAWDAKHLCFVARNGDRIINLTILIHRLLVVDICSEYSIEVRGNIYENPELLKE